MTADLILSPIPSKACSNCGESKSVFDFSKASHHKDGLSSRCRPCVAAYDAARRAANPEANKARCAEYLEKNREKNRSASADYYAKNKEEISIKAKEYGAKHADRYRANASRWYADNRDRAKVTRAAYYENNKKAFKEASALRYAANAEVVKLKTAEWRKANPEAKRTHNQNRRARKNYGGGKLSKGLAARLLVLQQGLCPCCREPLGSDFQYDHIVPLALGGLHADENIQLMRAVCNNRKNALHPVDYMQSRGFLI